MLSDTQVCALSSYLIQQHNIIVPSQHIKINFENILISREAELQLAQWVCLLGPDVCGLLSPHWHLPPGLLANSYLATTAMATAASPPP